MPDETDKFKIQRLGEKLRTIRLRSGLSTDQMAAYLGKTKPGRRSRVSEWEAGKRTPSLSIVLRYARFANISTDVLLDDELEIPPIEDSELGC
jgi:transcriptional regulator with XRE-family HTH domain